MHIKINDRDVVPATLVEAVLERPIRSIHFELNESFTFSDAFMAMAQMGVTLKEVQITDFESVKEVQITDFESVKEDSEKQLELNLVFPSSPTANTSDENTSDENTSDENTSDENTSDENTSDEVVSLLTQEETKELGEANKEAVTNS